MTNLLPFPSAPEHLGGGFLSDPTVHNHAVQFYDSESFLYETVGKFLSGGLRNGESLIVIATAVHREELIERLRPFDVERAISEGQLTLLDARETLARFMVADMPDAQLFHDLIARVIARTPAREKQTRIRAYGEMVDILWQDGNSRAAIRLEELWNDAIKTHSVGLLCAYVMGNFYKEGDTARFMEVCRTHSHVIPTEHFTDLDDAHARLREISLLQQRARALENEIHQRKQLEEALRDALRDRGRIEDELRACVQREKEARERAEANDAYKEMFLGILGHDLRNPLNTVLTTARLMKLRGEVQGDSERRVERIVSSGVRMERMIEQLLDVTRARLSDGIPVDRSRPHDLGPIVAKIVDEIRVAHPSRRIDVGGTTPCRAGVDPDRLEQVLSNLIGNAVKHGDPVRAITVELASRPGLASVSVHNFGPPIDPTLMPVLFNPFERGARREGHEGLGLGLYIAERIVTAHGGKLEVESSLEQGTRFEVLIPTSLSLLEHA